MARWIDKSWNMYSSQEAVASIKLELQVKKP